MNRNLIKTALFTPCGKNAHGEVIWGLPLILWGEPGIGKSAIIEMCGPWMNMPQYTLSPAEQGEGAFGVIPVPDADCKYLLNPLAEWTRPFDKAGRGILFVDELQLAAGTPVEKPLLRLVRARAIGARYLPGGVRVIAASNLAEISGGFDMLPALENRFGHWDVKFDYPAFRKWVQDGANGETPAPIDPVAEENRVLKIWEPEYRKAWQTALMFMEGHQDMIAPETADPRFIGKKARPSPRTWEYAVRVIASSTIHAQSQEDMELMISMFIGVEVGSQLCSFLEHLDLPSARDVLDGLWTPDQRRPDITAIALHTATSAVCEDGSQEAANKLWAVLDKICDQGNSDIVSPIAQILISAGLVEISTNGGKPKFISEKVMARINSVIMIEKRA